MARWGWTREKALLVRGERANKYIRLPKSQAGLTSAKREDFIVLSFFLSFFFFLFSLFISFEATSFLHFHGGCCLF